MRLTVPTGSPADRGRPPLSRAVRDLIRRMSAANPPWGAPHIVGELRKIGIDVVKSTAERYMVRRRKPPSTTWRAFLRNQVREIVAVDFFIVPTVRNQVIFVFLVLAHERRRLLHFNVTPNPTARWAAQQIVEAFPWVDPPRYLLRDRDKIYGNTLRARVTRMGFEELLIAARSPWQNPYVERLIGTIRRECLDHAIVIDERHLHGWRTHQALGMDCPVSREVQGPERGRVVEIPEVGGLRHHYERVAS